MDEPGAQEHHQPRVLRLKAALLALWAAASFGGCWFARSLDFTVGPWQFSYWFAAQGVQLAFVAIVAGYAWAMKRIDPDEDADGGEHPGG